MDTFNQNILTIIISIIFTIRHTSSQGETDNFPITQLYFILKRDIHISCLGVRPQTNNTYYWKKDGTSLEVKGLTLQIYPGEGSLRFKMPQSTDGGIYQCFAINVYGTAVSHKINFTNAVLHTFPTPSMEASIERVRVGKPLKLSCQPPYSNPPAIVYWGHNKDKSKLMPLPNNDRVSLDYDGNLYFSNIEESDSREGENYVCIADNKVLRILVQGSDFKIKPQMQDGLLRAKAPSLMWKSGAVDTAMNGKDKRIKCIFSGYPTPRITWRKKDGGMMPSHIHPKGQELHFKNVSFSDEGVYLCVAEVPGISKSASEEIRIVVEAVPRWRSKGLEDVVTSEDEDAQFSCSVFGTPKPSISWFINGVPIEEVDQSQMNLQLHHHTLTFQNVTKRDFRVVQCLAANIHGSLFKNAYLKILAEEPQITRPPGIVKVSIGQVAVLPCDFTGAPKPHNLWYRDKVEDGGDLDFGDKYDILENRALKINDIMMGDEGEYVCLVKNKFGKKNAIGKLVVLNNTRINTRPKNQVVTMASDVTFECSATTDDRERTNLTIEWFFEGVSISEMEPEHTSRHILKNDRSDFTITSAQVEDSGDYKCVTSNYVDSDEASFKLVVRDRPDPPYNVKADCTSNAARLSWKSGSDNNEIITAFTVYYNTSNDDIGEFSAGCNTTGNENTCSVLMYPWANFTYHVVAYNSLGASDKSPFSLNVCTTKAARPSRHPRSVCTRSGKPGTLVIFWEPMVKKEHSGPSFHYLISYRKKDNTFQNIKEIPSNFSKVMVTDWRQNEKVIEHQDIFKTYEIYVEAVNGEGAAETEIDMIIGFSSQDVPLVTPSNLKYVEDTLTSSSVTFSFNGVENNPEKIRGFMVGYELSYWKEGEDETRGKENLIQQKFQPCITLEKRLKRDTLQSDNIQEITVDKLWPYSTINAGVGVLNGAKCSELSNIVQFTTPEGVPDDVSEARVLERGSNHLKVSWTAPTEINGRFDGYIIVHKEKGPHASRYEAVVLDFKQCYKKLHGLKSMTHYEVEVWVKNGLHKSKNGYHLSSSTVLVSEPDTPHIEQIKSGFDYANITWMSSKEDALNPGKNYVIEYKKPGDEFWSETVSEEEHNWLNISSLQHGSPYHFRVVAFNQDGDKVFSEALVHTIGVLPMTETTAKQSSMLSWLVPLILLIFLFVLFLLILIFYFCKRRAQTGQYQVSVKEKRLGVRLDEEATFDEYLRSENSTFKKVKEGSLEGSNNSSCEDGSDSLGAYDDVDPSKFNDEGSFVDQSVQNGGIPNGDINESVALMHFKRPPEA